ncbi:uncharacterized protein LOC144671611 isoform X3 [Cetorhinus maximus]
MGSSQMKLRLVLFTLTLLLSLQLSHFFSLSKVDSAVGSLTIEKSVDSPDTDHSAPDLITALVQSCTNELNSRGEVRVTVLNIKAAFD